MGAAADARAAPTSTFLYVGLALLALASAADVPSCYNEGFKFRPTNWKDALEGSSTARLFLAKLWTSTAVPKHPLTIVTHGNIHRDKHVHQCRTWQGPLVAAMYMPIVQAGGARLNSRNQGRVQSVTEHFDKVHQWAERHGRCQLTIMLVWEVFSNHNDSWLYPTNDLRNLALTQARTPLVAMIDIDLLISVELSKVMEDPARLQEVERICDNHGVVTLPAFQFPTNMSMAKATKLIKRVVRGSKADVMRLVGGKANLIPFAFDQFPPGHNNTNYTRWYSATEPYEVPHDWHYEPWFIIKRSANPWYDASFRAYFYNKVMHVAHIASLGMHLVVHPTAYIMHRPHPVSRIFSNKELFTQLHDIMWVKSEAGKQAMANGTYTPNPGRAPARCIKQLPWWTETQYNWQDPGNWRTSAQPTRRQGKRSS